MFGLSRQRMFAVPSVHRARRRRVPTHHRRAVLHLLAYAPAPGWQGRTASFKLKAKRKGRNGNRRSASASASTMTGTLGARTTSRSNRERLLIRHPLSWLSRCGKATILCVCVCLFLRVLCFGVVSNRRGCRHLEILGSPIPHCGAHANL